MSFPIKGANNQELSKGWSFSQNHYLHPSDTTILYKGDGSIVRGNIGIIDSVAGGGTAGYPDFGEGGPATDAYISNLRNVDVDAAGNIYIAEHELVRKVDTNGIITTVAGNGSQGYYSGDGGPATDAEIVAADVAVDTEGHFYIAGRTNNRVRKVDTNGIITTVAGDGTNGYSGDGDLATDASLNWPTSVAVDTLGNLYIADLLNCRIRRVSTNGIITTVAGNGTSGYSGDDGPATEASLTYPVGVAVDTTGNIYIADNRRVRKVDTSGIITTVAGNGSHFYNDDGGLAIQSGLGTVEGVALDVAGNIYIACRGNNQYRIRKVDTSGIITTVEGNGNSANSGDGGPATDASFEFPWGVALDAIGSIYIADRYRIRKVEYTKSAYAVAGDITIAEEGGIAHIMSKSGRHKSTFDTNTEVTLRTFGYDASNNLISVTDQFGNQTTIERDGNDIPTAIVSPDGQRTVLAIDASNNLTRITYPDSNFYGFEYTPDGLMTAEIEPEGNRFDHTFDSNGRLTDVFDGEGGNWNYTNTITAGGDSESIMLTAEGNQTTYLDGTDSTGKYTSIITDPTGAETNYTQSADGVTAKQTLPCGMVIDTKYGLDPEYKFKFEKEVKESVPSGLERVTTRDNTYVDTNTDEIFDLITQQVDVNGKVVNIENNTILSKRTITTPEGRTIPSIYDPNTLLTESTSVPGLFDTTFGYDAKGRLKSMSTNTRDTSFTYDAQGFLESATDPVGNITRYTYDSVGRIKTVDQPDNNSLGFTYDKNGNMTVLTTPSAIDHGFGYNQVNLPDSYDTPISGNYQYVYDKDRSLTQVTFPSGMQINNVYTNGRLDQIQTPEGNIDYTYLCSAKIDSITKGAETATYGYDGPLVTSETMSGTLNQVLTYTYDNDFNTTSFTYAGSTENYSYDNDGLLTGAGAYTITHNVDNGLPEEVTDSTLILSRLFSGYGEIMDQDSTIGVDSLASWNLTRDDNGRITQKIETVDGTASTYDYTYDSMGRLRTVIKDSTLVEEYRYDANGTRNFETNTLKGIVGKVFTYSDEDHLLTAGTTTYQYDVDGFLTTETDGTDVTQYDYSSQGELLNVMLPDGTVVSHVHGSQGRRLTKSVNGTTTEKYLWQGLTRLLAVYDGSDNLLMRFEYADGRMPITMQKNGSKYYLSFDQVGSLKLVSDTSGNVVKQVDYDSFGNIINDTNTSFDVPLGFAGGLHDIDTGLVRFGARDYDPEVGRWTAKDPIGFDGGDPNLYGYVRNDPVNQIDPEGEKPCKDKDKKIFNVKAIRNPKGKIVAYKKIFSNGSIQVITVSPGVKPTFGLPPKAPDPSGISNLKGRLRETLKNRNTKSSIPTRTDSMANRG